MGEKPDRRTEDLGRAGANGHTKAWIALATVLAAGGGVFTTTKEISGYRAAQGERVAKIEERLKGHLEAPSAAVQAKEIERRITELLSRYDIHLETVEGRLDDIEDFHKLGGRFTMDAGQRLAEILEEAIVACSDDDPASLSRSLSDIRAFRASKPQARR